jgi:hypothetical protein
MVAMTKSFCARKEKIFLATRSGMCVVVFCTSHKIQFLGTANEGRRFGTGLQPTTTAIGQLEENAKIS